MSLTVAPGRVWTALPVRRSVLAILPHRRGDGTARAWRSPHQQLCGGHGVRWASQGAGDAAEVSAGKRPDRALERPILPENLQKIVDAYDEQDRQENERLSRFGFLFETKYAGVLGMAVAGIIAFAVSTFDDTASGVHEVTAFLLRRLGPERARDVFVGAAAWGLTPRDYDKDDPYLVTEPLEGLKFSTPVGLSGGFDRQARAPNAFFNLGFGFAEVGPIFAESHEVDANVIAVRERLAARERSAQVSCMGILGVAIGGGRVALEGLVEQFGSDADYFVVDLGLVPPAERSEEALKRLLAATVHAASDFSRLRHTESGDTVTCVPPVFLRVPAAWPQAGASAGLRRSAAKDAALAAVAGGVKGLVLEGGSHTVLREMLSDVYLTTNGGLILVADGVKSGIESLECIEAGASLVQISSLLLTEGPGACRRMKSELVTVLWKEHYTCLQEAVGAAHRRRQRTGRKKNLWRARE